jgi:hypothetical protein
MTKKRGPFRRFKIRLIRLSSIFDEIFLPGTCQIPLSLRDQQNKCCKRSIWQHTRPIQTSFNRQLTSGEFMSFYAGSR